MLAGTAIERAAAVAEAQGWTSCSSKVWQKAGLQTAVIDAVNVSGFSGWLDQRPVGGTGCVQPTPVPS